MKLRKVFTAAALVAMLVISSLATGCISWGGGGRDRDRGERDFDRGGERGIEREGERGVERGGERGVERSGEGMHER